MAVEEEDHVALEADGFEPLFAALKAFTPPSTTTTTTTAAADTLCAHARALQVGTTQSLQVAPDRDPSPLNRCCDGRVG
jgi:hypothetical protein